VRGAGTTTMAMVAVLTCVSWPAVAQTIVVTPGSPRPGQKVHISVPGCSAGPTAHVAVSSAFVGNVTLYGKADTGDAEPVIRQEAKPGTYPITAYCGARTVQGQVSVTGEDHPSAGPGDRTNNWLFGVIALVVAGVAAVFVLGRRRKGLS
jgi:hypothetical protein